jgi:hypothetical protein
VRKAAAAGASKKWACGMVVTSQVLSYLTVLENEENLCGRNNNTPEKKKQQQ